MKKILAIFLIFLCSSCSSEKASNETLGNSSHVILGYAVPQMLGWHSKVYSKKGGFAHSVSYKKLVGDTTALMKFSVLEPAKGFPPETIVTLRKFEDETEKVGREFDPTTVILQRKEISYKGHPGILVQTSSKGVEFTTLRVADGANTIVFSKSLIGKVTSQEVRQEVENAWQQLLSGAKFPKEK